MDYLYAIILFAISSSVTPGPNNIMVMTSGVNFGVKKSLPLLSGICIGFAFMLLLVGIGFSRLFEWFPGLHMLIKCAGVLYLLYLALLIARSADTQDADNQGQPLSFLKGALFQWINGKAWVVATGAVAAFTTVGGGVDSQTMLIATIFLLVSFPCVGVWLLFGSLLQNWLSSAASRQRFNLAMALLLVISVLPVLQEILVQLSVQTIGS
ncbi:LysE family translocator [Pseudoalteromonas sp. DL2-H2.2]|uniref:Amino acid transporter LysE n=1 Tax=Pseudoalteromonas rubra TaxID=43658 RepID=A0A0F4QD79_9GAMM|nr:MULTISPECIES: LysE family translocator [Pseudoalteromonas]KJZ05653.1 amino acid transporter LysE [Pseudoalteromonas rubra]MCF2907101.1 LysE family translocator [Pseudoalteromonas sp. DL2-H2.2]